MPDRARKPHVVSDFESRLLKAEKIIRLIGEERFENFKTGLEVGCGSGVISSALALAGQGGLEMHAVDVVDKRIDHQGYAFTQIVDTHLPFADEKFDLVISNHVIEHVGGRSAQLHHLQEIHRVLKPGGLLYFAVPNKWRLFEPHYRLFFLSWLPQILGDWLVRATKKGDYYDCRPLSSAELLALFEAAQMSPNNATLQAIRATLDIERKNHLITRLVNRYVPSWLLALSTPIIPTFVYILKRKEA